MDEAKKLWNDLLTGIDNKTYDSGRFSFFLSVTFLSLMTFLDFWLNHHFSATSYSAGVAALAGGHGALIKLKETTEPSA